MLRLKGLVRVFPVDRIAYIVSLVAISTLPDIALTCAGSPMRERAIAGAPAVASVIAGIAGAAFARARSPDARAEGRAGRSFAEQQPELRIGSPSLSRVLSPTASRPGIDMMNGSYQPAATSGRFTDVPRRPEREAVRVPFIRFIDYS